MAAQILIYQESTVQLNHRVCRPCMITLREPTMFDTAAPGDVGPESLKRARTKNLEAREIYTQKPYHDQVETSLRSG